MVPVTTPEIGIGEYPVIIHTQGKLCPPGPVKLVAVVKGTAAKGDLAEPEIVATTGIDFWESTPPTITTSVLSVVCGPTETISQESDVLLTA
jgi:hypothetical protein